MATSPELLEKLRSGLLLAPEQAAKQAGVTQSELSKFRRELFPDQVTTDEGKFDPRVQKIFDLRSGLGAEGTGRLAASFFAEGSNVHAPFGKQFELFAGGGVRIVDIRTQSPEEIEIDKTREQTSLFDQPAPGETIRQEDISLVAASGKTIKRSGRSGFNPATGVDVQVEDDEIFIEYTDGTFEVRKVTDIDRQGDTADITTAGKTAEELGIDRGTEIKGPDGEIVRAPQSAAEAAGEVDNSNLEYIGKEYTAEGGEKRVAGEGNAFYQDPETRTILERPDTGQENSLKTTSPSVLASRNDIPGMFEAVYGRLPNAQELQYWEGRKDKSGSALVGAMQFAKNEGRTIGGAAEGEGGDPIEAIDSTLNAGQDIDFAKIGAETNLQEFTSKSSKLIEDLTKMLNEKPSVPSLQDEFQNELLRSGFNEDAAELADAERAIKQLDADFLSTLEGEEARRVSVGQIRRRQSAQELNYNRIRRDMVVDRDFLANKVANKQALVNTMVNLLGQDIANAQAAYQNSFQNAMSITNLVRQVEQDQLTQLQRQQDNARANVQIMSSLLSSGNISYSQLDASTKSQLKSMELQAGLPIGFTQFVSETIQDPEVQFLPAYTDINGVRIQPIATVDPKTGAYTIKNINQGKVDLPAGSGSGSKPTEGAISRGATADMASQLNSVRGSDGFVSPEAFRIARQAWVGRGFATDDFNSNFRPYANPADLQDYGYKVD